MVVLKKSAVLAMFKALGFKQLDTWTDARVLAKVQSLPKAFPEATKVEGKAEQATFSQIWEAHSSKEEIEVEDDLPVDTPDLVEKPAKKKAAKAPKKTVAEEEETPAPKAAKGKKAKGKTEKAPAKEVKSETKEVKTPKKKAVVKEEEKPAETSKKAPAKTNKDGSPKKQVGGFTKVGIIATIIECLKKGSSKKPVTKAQIHEVLVEKFPDRNPDSMRVTINCQVPRNITLFKGLEVQKDGKGGFWLPK